MAFLFWSVILIVCVFAEVHTNAFVPIFVALGAAVALVLDAVGVPFPVQALGWVAVSVGTLASLRPLALRRFGHHHYEMDMTQPTHSNMTHLTGLVEAEVGDEAHPGRVKIQGESWRAVTDWPECLGVGTKVTVDRTRGTTLWVIPS